MILNLLVVMDIFIYEYIYNNWVYLYVKQGITFVMMKYLFM